MSVRRSAAAAAGVLLLALIALLVFVPADEEPPASQDAPASRSASPAPAAGGSSPQPPSPTPEPLPDIVPASDSALMPPLVLGWEAEQRSGIPEVDAVIDAVVGGDASAMRGLIRYSIMACWPELQGAGSPPVCADGERAFEGILVVLVSTCGIEHVRATDDGWVHERLTGGEPRLYALLKPSGLDQGFWPEAQYVVVFLSDLPQLWSSVVVQDGAIMSVRLGCGESPAETLARVDADDVLLPPPQWGLSRVTGLDAVDDAIYAVAIRDLDVLRLSVRPSLVGCVTAEELPSRRPLCAIGESFGDEVEALPVSGCRDGYLRKGAELNEALESLVHGTPSLYGVFEGGARPWPEGEYDVLVAVEDRGEMRGISLVVSGRGVVGLRIGCDESVGELLAEIEAARSGPVTVILPPR